MSDDLNTNLIESFIIPMGDMSDGSSELFFGLFSALFGDDLGEGLLNDFFNVIIDILPFALTVAGSILVVKLGWRLFRNFTRG